MKKPKLLCFCISISLHIECQLFLLVLIILYLKTLNLGYCARFKKYLSIQIIFICLFRTTFLIIFVQCLYGHLKMRLERPWNQSKHLQNPTLKTTISKPLIWNSC
eukprot:NODE_901_length_3242_cov_0.168629.p3 type:complete len:105 gc:universal NODE_901_length_3242_cov_0.168629:1080-1394(+)